LNNKERKKKDEHDLRIISSTTTAAANLGFQAGFSFVEDFLQVFDRVDVCCLSD